jgi:hypothetical protein
MADIERTALFIDGANATAKSRFDIDYKRLLAISEQAV